jgi:hypothetical protein
MSSFSPSTGPAVSNILSGFAGLIVLRSDHRNRIDVPDFTEQHEPLVRMARAARAREFLNAPSGAVLPAVLKTARGNSFEQEKFRGHDAGATKSPSPHHTQNKTIGNAIQEWVAFTA